MAEISQKEQLALHEFSVRYRAAYAASHPLNDLHLETFQDAVRSDWEKEQQANRGLEISGPEISGPEIGPSSPEKEPEPEEPGA